MKQSMRVLVVGPLSRIGAPNQLPWLRYTTDALRRLGHSVVAAAYRESWAVSPAVGACFAVVPGARRALKRYAIAMDARRDRRVVAAARRWRPRLTVVLKGEVFSAGVLADIRRYTDGPLTSWWVDDPWRHPAAVRCFAMLDRVFLFDRSYLAELAAAGVTQTAFLPCACDETVFHPQSLSAGERHRLATDVAFVASYYPQRAALARALAERLDVGIWGTGWETAEAQRELDGRSGLIRGGIVKDRSAARIYSATKIGLNIHHRQSRLGGVNQRTFELLASGTVPLVDRLPGIEELLEPDREIVCYDTPEHACGVAAALAVDAAQREAIVRRGRARVLAEHTFVARMRTLCRVAWE